MFTRAVLPFAPGQGPGLRKNLSGALPLRRWTARIRQRRKAMLSFLSRMDILDRDLPACHQVVADKVLRTSVLCKLSARFSVRKYHDSAHCQAVIRHVLPQPIVSVVLKGPSFLLLRDRAPAFGKNSSGALSLRPWTAHEIAEIKQEGRPAPCVNALPDDTS